MLNFKQLQLQANKLIAQENKKYILKKLEEYYIATDYSSSIKAKEFAVFEFWKAKKQGRLDNLNRLNYRHK